MASVIPATAQKNAYLDEYNAYNAALDAGDQAAAARHGYAAWQAAEKELGDHELTAVLAYNYGQLLLYSDTAAALRALKRASALQQNGVADLPEAELALYLAYAEFAIDKATRANRDALRQALLALERNGVEANEDMAAMWHQIGVAYLSDKDFDDAYESAINAETAIAASAPGNYRRRAEALLVASIAKITDRSGTTDDLLSANRHLVDAAGLFPPQHSIESFDPLLAQIFAWNLAAQMSFETHENLTSAYATQNRATRIDVTKAPGFANLADNGFIQFNLSRVFPERESLESCGTSWAFSPNVRYPQNLANRGIIGAVVLGYKLGDDVYVKEPKILAQVPDLSFGKEAMRTISKWRLENPPADRPGCRDGFLLNFGFFFY